MLLIEVEAVFIGELHVGYSITTREKPVKVLAVFDRQDGLFFLLTQFILALKGEVFSLQNDKALWFGRTFYQIGTFFPSSKTCHGCQFVVDSLPLHIREWECPNCKSHNDRDLNASLNIRDKGLLDLKNLNVKSGSGI